MKVENSPFTIKTIDLNQSLSRACTQLIDLAYRILQTVWQVITFIPRVCTRACIQGYIALKNKLTTQALSSNLILSHIPAGAVANAIKTVRQKSASVEVQERLKVKEVVEATKEVAQGSAAAEARNQVSLSPQVPLLKSACILPAGMECGKIRTPSSEKKSIAELEESSPTSTARTISYHPSPDHEDRKEIECEAQPLFDNLRRSIDPAKRTRKSSSLTSAAAFQSLPLSDKLQGEQQKMSLPDLLWPISLRQSKPDRDDEAMIAAESEAAAGGVLIQEASTQRRDPHTARSPSRTESGFSTVQAEQLLSNATVSRPAVMIDPIVAPITPPAVAPITPPPLALINPATVAVSTDTLSGVISSKERTIAAAHLLKPSFITKGAAHFVDPYPYSATDVETWGPSTWSVIPFEAEIQTNDSSIADDLIFSVGALYNWIQMQIMNGVTMAGGGYKTIPAPAQSKHSKAYLAHLAKQQLQRAMHKGTPQTNHQKGQAGFKNPHR